MWIFSFISDEFLIYIVNCILIIGAISTFLSFFVINRLLRWWPGMAAYYHILQILSLVVFVAGVYFKGGYSTELEWREKVKEAEEKVAKAEQLSAQANKALEEKVATKTKVIKEKGQTIYQYIDREVVKDKEVIKFVENCPIPSAVIKSHNAAALNQPIEEKK
jgi:hypothetical protein